MHLLWVNCKHRTHFLLSFWFGYFLHDVHDWFLFFAFSRFLSNFLAASSSRKALTCCGRKRLSFTESGNLSSIELSAIFVESKKEFGIAKKLKIVFLYHIIKYYTSCFDKKILPDHTPLFLLSVAIRAD